MSVEDTVARVVCLQHKLKGKHDSYEFEFERAQALKYDNLNLQELLGVGVAEEAIRMYRKRGANLFDLATKLANMDARSGKKRKRDTSVVKQSDKQPGLLTSSEKCCVMSRRGRHFYNTTPDTDGERV